MTNLNENTFDAFVANPELTLVDFWASWCGPCRMLAPALETVGQKYRVAKVDTEENPSLTRRFKINSLPTMLFFKDGQVVGQPLIGLRTAAQIEAEFAGRA